MKTLNLYAALLFSIFAFSAASAQTVKTETLKVWGNCGMCKKTIEKAASKAGATKAVWNEDSKELKVTYAVSKTSANSIQQAIANSGYDTQDFTAEDAVYNKLHGCCKYERKAVNASMKTGTEKCCENVTCGTAKDCCKDIAACTDKGCCAKKDGVALHCTKDPKTCKMTVGADGKSCCK